MTFTKRKVRTRIKIRGTSDRPRLSVYKSNKYVSAQIIDDEKGVTLAFAKGEAKELGKMIAEKALKAKIKKVVFDKGGYMYHGKIKAVADGAREGGLEF